MAGIFGRINKKYICGAINNMSTMDYWEKITRRIKFVKEKSPEKLGIGKKFSGVYCTKDIY